MGLPEVRDRVHEQTPEEGTMKERCKECRFYDPFKGPPAGLCRRRAPVPMTVLGNDFPESIHPNVSETEWCGEWESKEGKVSDGS